MDVSFVFQRVLAAFVNFLREVRSPSFVCSESFRVHFVGTEWLFYFFLLSGSYMLLQRCELFGRAGIRLTAVLKGVGRQRDYVVSCSE